VSSSEWHGRADVNEKGMRLDRWLERKARLTRQAVEKVFREKRVLRGREPALPDATVVLGQVYRIIDRAQKSALLASKTQKKSPSSAVAPVSVAKPKILYQDQDLVVVNKPTGITTCRNPRDLKEFGPNALKFLPPTMADRLPGILAKPGAKPPRVFPVHRLDRETSGVLVFALNDKAASALSRDFRKHRMNRTYLALTRGLPKDGWIRNELVRDRGDGRRGSGTSGESAATLVETVEAHGWGALVRCTLETGRTHQVRIHLGEQGTPLCGETIYDRPIHGKALPDPSGAKRIMLHAHTLSFTHPGNGKVVSFESPPPADFSAILKLMRQGKPAR